MKIKTISIKNFGKFSDQTFILSDSLNVFFGENEAGKSTLVAFITQIIFGFVKGNKRGQNNYQPKPMPDLFGGSITFSNDKEEWILERYYNPKNKSGDLTVYLNGAKTPDVKFFDLIKNIDEDFFTDSFLFNQETLGKILTLSEQELVRQINYLGASDSSAWMDLASKLDKEANKVYKGSGRAKNPEINDKIQQLTELSSELQVKQAELKIFKAQADELAPLDANLKKLEQELAQVEELKAQKLQQEHQLAIFSDYQAKIKQKIPNLDFNQKDFDNANQLVIQINQLQNKVENLTKNLTNSTDVHLDEIQVKEILNSWNEINFIENNLLEKSRQFEEGKLNLERIDNFQPEVKQVAHFTGDQLVKFKSAVKEFDSNSQDDNQPIKKSTEYFGVYVGLLIMVLAIISLIFGLNKVASIGALIIGLLISFFANKNKKNKGLNDTFDSSTVQDARIAFKNQFGVEVPDNLNELLLKADKYVQDEQRQINLGEELNQLTGQIAIFKKELSSLTELDYSKSDWETISKTMQELQTKIHDQTLQQERQQLVKNELEDVQKNLIEDKHRLEKILLANNAESMEQYRKIAEQFRTQQVLISQIKVLEQNLGNNLQRFLNLEITKASITSQLANLNQQKLLLKEQISQNQQQVADVRSSQKQLADDSTVLDLKQDISGRQQEILDLLDSWLTQKLGSKWITAMLNEASANRFPKMKVAAQKYFMLLSGNHYQKLEIKTNEIRVFSAENKKGLLVHQLSRGTAEQLYFALKLAFVEQIHAEISLPIIIDDAFVNFDQQRVQYMQELLLKLAEKNQVLLFTARADLAEMFTNSELNLIRM